jgi:hypothetical protein
MPLRSVIYSEGYKKKGGLYAKTDSSTRGYRAKDISY